MEDVYSFRIRNVGFSSLYLSYFWFVILIWFSHENSQFVIVYNVFFNIFYNVNVAIVFTLKPL